MALGGGIGLGKTGANAGKAGFEFSHWLPNRLGGPRSLLNGNYVTIAEHALMDPSRYRFMSTAFKLENPQSSALIQQLSRLPYWITGAAAGAGYSNLDAAASMKPCGCK